MGFGSFIFWMILLKCIVEFPISIVYIRSRNWSVWVICAVNPLDEAVTIVPINIIVDINSGKINSVGFMIWKPMREIKHKLMQMPNTIRFGCERATHRFTVKTRMDDITLKTST